MLLPFDAHGNFFLIAGHDVLGKGNLCTQAFGSLVARCGGEAFYWYSPMIRSHLFSEPVPLTVNSTSVLMSSLSPEVREDV